MEFAIERLAIHLVDRRSHTAPIYSKKQVILSRARREVKSFLSDHIREIWQAENSATTRSAVFLPKSEVKRCYQQLTTNSRNFYQKSCLMAKRLYDVSRRTASPGLFLMMLFKPSNGEGSDQRFLAFFKLDPLEDTRFKLNDAKGNLNIAVRKIHQALPEAKSQRVLKCALIGHPESSDYELKFWDKQTSLEPTKYFAGFLGCEPKKSNKKQIKALLDFLDIYGAQNHPEEDWGQKIPSFISNIEAKTEPVRLGTVINAINEVGLYTGFKTSKFKKEIAETPAGDLFFSPKNITQMKLSYTLPSGIVIKGPIDQMKSKISIKEIAGGVEFTIKSTKDFGTKYD